MSSAICNLQFAICNLQSLLCASTLIAATLYICPSNSAAAELQWQRGRTPRSQSAAHGNARFQRHRDAAVRTVAFEDEAVSGPRLTSGSEGRATFRSIVVNRDDQPDTVRSAQLPGTSRSNAPTTPRAGDSLEEKLGTPFGDLPQQPPLETPDLDKGLNLETPPLDENESQLQLDNQREPGDRAPQTFQPLPPPQRSTTEPSTTDSSLQQEITPDITSSTPESGTSQKSCETSLANLKAKTIGTVDLSIAVTGKEGEDFPFECTIDDGTWYGGRCWPQTTYLWKASALCHKPLYFEDEQLERYGHSWPPCVQPFVSGAHFFCTLPVLPYCMGVEPPMECIYALGHYRPGNCAPYMFDPVPLSCPRRAVRSGRGGRHRGGVAVAGNSGFRVQGSGFRVQEAIANCKMKIAK